MIRDIRDDEYALLPAIENTAGEMFHSIGIHGLPGAPEPDAWRSSVFVLVAGDPPKGFAAVFEADGQAHLEQVSVHIDHARQGIGARLVEAVKERAAALGYERMTLLTYADVPWNAPYYRRLGFETFTDLGPDLRRFRQTEVALGLDDHGERVAMSCPLRP